MGLVALEGLVGPNGRTGLPGDMDMEVLVLPSPQGEVSMSI